MKSDNRFYPCTMAKLANLAKQTLEAPNLPGDPAQPEQTTLPESTPAPAGSPWEPRKGASLADDTTDPPGWLVARLECVAILEYKGEMSREEAECEAAHLYPELDPGEAWHAFTRRELLAMADPTERADLEAAPDALAAYAFALRLAESRARGGERPDRYTRTAYCETCGPVWLFPGERTRVLGCPWCEHTATGRPTPRPPVACSNCLHWRPDETNTPGGLGSCTIEAPASKRPGALWPRGTICCEDWRPET